MEKSSIDTIEIGNLLWGHSRGEYAIPRDEWQDYFCQFLEECGFDSYGRIDKEELETFLQTDYGDAVLARDTDVNIEKVEKFGEPFVLPDGDKGYRYNGELYEIFFTASVEFEKAWDKWNDEYNAIFERKKDLSEEELDHDEELNAILKKEPQYTDFPLEKRISNVIIRKEHEHYFENDTFAIRGYYWGDSKELMCKPNFIFKPADFAMSWYKYPLRDAYCNADISFEEFKTIVDECRDSVLHPHMPLEERGGH